jgi:hypothetical protein
VSSHHRIKVIRASAALRTLARCRDGKAQVKAGL